MSLLNLIADALFGTNSKEKKEKSARESAKERLHLVLVNDRAGQLAPDFMPKMRQELLEVLKSIFPSPMKTMSNLTLLVKRIPTLWKCQSLLKKQTKKRHLK